MTKKMIFTVCLTVAMLFTLSISTNAQVPSIPRKSSTQPAKSKSSNVAWGTEYDFLSTRYIDYSDISDYDKGQIRVLKNSIYARHGRIFKDKALREYFNNQSWYRGTRNEIPAKELNKFEQANIAFLKQYE